MLAVIGGLVYMGIEILWRGHTHWTMGVLGGLCFALIGLLDEWQEHPPLWLQMLQGAMIVTVLELLAGLVVAWILIFAYVAWQAVRRRRAEKAQKARWQGKKG